MNGRKLTKTLWALAFVSSRSAYAQVEESVPQAPDIRYFDSWDAPQECISSSELRARISLELPADAAPADRTLEGQIIRSEQGFELRFVVRDAGVAVGRRIVPLQGTDCRVHDESVVLVAALLLEHGPPPESPAEQPPPPPPPVESPVESESPPLADGELVRRYTLSIGAESAFGWMPRFSVGPRLGFGYLITPFVRAELVGSFFPPVTQERAQGDLWSMGMRTRARLCALPGGGSRWAAHACGGAGLWGLWGSGKNILQENQGFFSTFALGADVGASVRFWKVFSAVIEAELDVALRRGDLVFQATDDPNVSVLVHDTKTWIPGLFAGVFARF